MATELNFYINNKIVNPPDNWGDLSIEVDFTNNSSDATIRTTVLEWKGDNAKTLNDWLNNGLLTGVGIFEGIPFRIEACDPTIVIFNGCIDMTSSDTSFTCDIVKASIKETQRAYFLNDTANGFTFMYLATAQSKTTAFNPGTFTPIQLTDYVSIPYVINYVPDYFNVALSSLSIVELGEIIGNNTIGGGLWQTLKILVEKTITDIASGFADVIGAAAWALQVVMDLLLLGLYILYVLMILSSIISLIDSMIENLISLTKYKYGMFVRTLFQKACDYLGLNFSSTIFNDPKSNYYNLVLIPKKQAYILNDSKSSFFNDMFSFLIPGFLRKEYDDEVNNNSYGYYEGTFTQLIMDMEKVFNAKIAVRNVNGVNTLHFERWDFWNAQVSYTLPPVSTEAPFDNPYNTNASEIASNYLVKWGLDSTDYNTYDSYEGTSCQMQLIPNIINNQNNVLLKNLNEIQLPFSLAKRKIHLTPVERLCNTIFDIILPAYDILKDIVNTVGGLIGAKHILHDLDPNPFDVRIGYMLLSSDFTGMPKLLVSEGSNYDVSGNGVKRYKINDQNTKGAANNSPLIPAIGYLDAFKLQTDFHAASWPIDTLPFFDYGQNKLVNPNTFPNQYLLYKDNEIPLCCSDFATLLNNNILQTHDGRLGRLDSMRWNPHFQTAKVDYRIKEKYTNNLQQVFIVDGL